VAHERHHPDARPVIDHGPQWPAANRTFWSLETGSLRALLAQTLRWTDLNFTCPLARSRGDAQAPVALLDRVDRQRLTGTWPGGRGRPDQPVDPEFASLLLACTGGVLALLWLIVALRVARIRSLFDSGEELEARVEKVSRFRGGSTLKLGYELAGTTYRVRSSFQGSSRIPTFTVGDHVSLLVDPMNPKRAVPIALYESDSSNATASRRATG